MTKKEAPWADTPFALIPTPGSGQDINKLPTSVWIARDMCCAHNNMLRALNSIYQQAPFVTTPTDIRDLLLYAQFWCSWLEEHHEGEENYFFPQLETVTGVKGLMETNVNQHHAFTGGLAEMERFVKETGVAEYDGYKLRGILDDFGPALTRHLADEIQTLLGLGEFENQKEIKKVYEAFDLKMREGDKAILFPMVLGSSDRDYEESFTWPLVPGPVRYLVHYVFERKYQGAWRFSPSTTWGERRPLMFTGETKD